MHTQFIEPFEQRLRDLGAEIRFHQRVKKLVLDGQRVVDVCFEDHSRLGAAYANDLFVLATPPEVTRRFVDDGVYAAERAVPETGDSPASLADLEHLITAPMASLTVYLNRRIDLPKEHISLIGSRHSISFVDVAQHWPEIDRQRFPTVLNLIAGNFEALHGLSDTAMTQALMSELTSYVTAIEPQDIAKCHLKPNLKVPLFLNTVGSWRFRPETRTRLINLYITGDYCRTEADLTTMESAIGSALATARDLLQDQGLPSSVGLKPLKPRGARYFTLLTYLLLPVIAIVVAGQKVGLLPKRHLEPNKI